jgi:protein-S-isoprenylcysteine O-methyltransferase Ste14
MNSIPLVILLLTGILLIKAIWLITDVRAGEKQISKKLIKSNLFEISFLFLQAFSGMFFPWPTFGTGNFFLIVGLIMYVSGLLLVSWSRYVMRKSWGHPGQHDINFQPELVTEGPFAISRNPIYVGFALLFLGFPIAIRSWFIFLEFPAVWYMYKSALKEEKLLEKHFGKQYSTYKSRVPRFLFV